MISLSSILTEADNRLVFDQDRRAIGRLVAAKPRLSICQYAEQYRYLAKGVSAKTIEGERLYSSKDAPHQRKPQEACTDKSVQMVVLIMASQIGGKTEIFNNVIAYHMDWTPRNMVVMYPQLDAAEKYSKKKLAPMIQASPRLREIVKPARSRDSGNTILTKDFSGGSIYMVGANSPASLRGTSGAVLLGDEVDSYEDSAGTEGDSVELLWKRGESFPDCIKLLASTPTNKGSSKIWGFWETSDQEFWFVPCPKCGRHQQLTWKQVTWPAGEPERAELICSLCQAGLNDAQRIEMYHAGEWRPTAPFSGIMGFHLNGIYCPWLAQKGYKNRLHQMAADAIRAKRGGERKLQVWVNTFLCELWETETEKIDHLPILKRAEAYTPEALPEGVIVVMASVDVQKDRIECETVGLGLDDETWGVEFRKFFGDTEQDEVWDDLAQHLSTQYKREDAVMLPITCTAVDMRHKPHKVRLFVKRSGIPRVYPVYGVGQSNQVVLVTARLNKHYRLRTYAVNSKHAKDTIFARLKIVGPDGESVEGGPRYMHFPQGQGYNEEYFLQLVAEVLKKEKVRGVMVEKYVKVRERNEALDIRVYFLAEVDILKPNLTAIAKQQKANAPPDPVREYELSKAQVQKDPKPDPLNKHHNGPPGRPGNGDAGTGGRKKMFVGGRHPFR